MPTTERPRRIGRLLRAASVLTLLASAASAQQEPANDAASAAARDDRARARRSFELGVELARAGRYEEAKREFSSAYQAHPHYAVLYNIAQADIQLGNDASAVAWLERYLLEGGAALREEERLAAQRQLDALRSRPPEETSNEATPAMAESTPADAVAESGLPFAGAEPAPAVAAAPPPLAAAAAPAFVADPLAPAPVVAAEEAPPPRWGWILAGAGAALLGTAAGLYIWNGERHERWERDRREIDAIPNRDAVLRTDLQRWNEAKANNDLLSSIQTIDVVALALAGTGALSLGAGAWELMLRPAPGAHAASSVLVSGHTRW